MAAARGFFGRVVIASSYALVCRNLIIVDGIQCLGDPYVVEIDFLRVNERPMSEYGTSASGFCSVAATILVLHRLCPNAARRPITEYSGSMPFAEEG